LEIDFTIRQNRLGMGFDMAAETPSNDTYKMVGLGLGFRFDLAWNQGVAEIYPDT
jgi:hypothetical protein